MTDKKKHNVFIDGPVTPAFIAEKIGQHSKKTNIGGHDIFLGQVRSDIINDKKVVAIEYSAYREMAEDQIHEIRENAFKKFDLVCMHIYHSLGQVKAGEICLFVFVSSRHRQAAFDACRDIVEQIKALTPIWGRELFEDETHVWKQSNQ